MTPNQFKAAIAALGLSQQRAGELFGRSPRTGQSWALGEHPVPAAVAILLRLVMQKKITLADIEST